MNHEPSASQLPDSVRSSVASDKESARVSDEDRLRQAMAPIMEKSLVDALGKGNQSLIDSMYPLIGRAVRRSVRESLAALAQSVDTTMRDALTLKQLRWRLEARRQGISLAQLVLQKSLLFRVEEAFLIHQKTGLLLAHVGARADDNRDLISGMFTAIQDFVADSFGGNAGETVDSREQPDQLGRFQVGDQDVWLFHGPSAYMAIVIAGNMPGSYREHFHAVLEEIHERYGAELAAYEGDGEALKPAGLLLEDCLIERQLEAAPQSPRLFWILATVVGLILLGWMWKSWQTKRLHERVQTHLESQVGVVITESSRNWRNSQFDVLADPEVLDVQAAVDTAFPDEPVSLNVATFRSMEPAARVARLQHALDRLEPAPETPVLVESHAEGVRLKGSASHDWLLKAREILPTLGVGAIDFSEFTDADLAQCEQLSQGLASIVVEFLPNQSKVAPNESAKWRPLGQGMRSIMEIAGAAKLPCRFLLYAKAPEETAGNGQWQLYQERVRVAQEALQSHGIPASVIHQGGWLSPDKGDAVSAQGLHVLSSFLLSPVLDRE